MVVRGYQHAKEVSARIEESKASNVIATAWNRRGEKGARKPSEAPADDKPAEGSIVDDAVPSMNQAEPPSGWTAWSEALLSKTRAFRPPKGSDMPATGETAPQTDAADAQPEAAEEPEPALPTSPDMPAPTDLEGDPVSDPPQQLVFCVHGIGQKLSEDYLATHFVHDLDRLRVTMRYAPPTDPDNRHWTRPWPRS